MRKLFNIIGVGLLTVPFALSKTDVQGQASNLRFVAHDGARGSVVANKRYIVPYVLSTRSSRTLDRMQDTTTSDWVPGIHGDIVFEDISDYTRVGRQWATNVHRNSDLARRPGTYTWKNCFVTPSIAPYNAGMKWGLRAYNMPQSEFVDCDFFAIPKEHGLYISNYEGTVVDNCTFVRMGSQGVQFAHRALPYQQYSADNRPYESKPLHILRDSHFIDCAQGGSRPSYNASYFNPGSPSFPGTLLVENCSFVCKWSRPRSDGYQSTGALVVTPMQGNETLTANFMELVYVKNCLFDFTNPDRSLINIRGVDTVIFEDCTFIVRDSLRGHVDIDSATEYLGDAKTQRVILRNCISVGNAQLRIFERGASAWNDCVRQDLNSYGKEVIINGETGQIISSGAYN